MSYESRELTEYKGYKIRIDGDGTFYVEDEKRERIAAAKTLDEMKQTLDRISKSRLLQNKVFISNRDTPGHRIVQGRVTSFRKTGYSYGGGQKFEFRVTWPSARDTTDWSHVAGEALIKDTKENVAKILQFNKLYADSEALKAKADELAETLEYYTEEELLGEPPKKKAD